MGTATPKKAKGREGKVDVEVKDRGWQGLRESETAAEDECCKLGEKGLTHKQHAG